MAVARKRATRATTSRCEGQGWHVGARAWRRRNGGLSLVQCPSMVYGPSVASLARRARVGSSLAGPRPRRERAQRRASALHAKATSRREGQGWHVGARAGADERRSIARAVPFHSAWTQCRWLGAARTRVGSARAGPRPQRERAQWRASALHAQATSRCEGQGWHVGARAWRRRTGGLSPEQCPSMVYRPSVVSLARRARASDAHVLGLVPKESERSGAQARYTRKPPRAVRGRAGTLENEPGAEEKAASRSCSALPRFVTRVSPAWRGARASEAHVLGLVSRESDRSGAQARYTRKAPRAVRGRAGT